MIFLDFYGNILNLDMNVLCFLSYYVYLSILYDGMLKVIKVK